MLDAKQEAMVTKVSFFAVLIGALNWGLVVFDYNIVEMLFDSMPTIKSVIYGVIGLGAVWLGYQKWGKGKKLSF